MGVLLLVLALYTVLPQTYSQTCVPSANSCPATSSHALLPANHSLPHLYVGGIFGVHGPGASLYSCGALRDRGFQNMEAFLWAVSTFKSRYSEKLTGISVGAVGIDSCGSSETAIQQVLNLETCQLGYGSPFLEPTDLLAYIGPDTSSQAQVLAPALGGLNKTLVSHAATSSTLTGINHFLRTVPSDSEQIQAMVTMLKQQAVKYIQVVYSGDTYGRTAWQDLQAMVTNNDICVVNQQEIPLGSDDSHMDTVIRNLAKSQQTKVVVVLTSDQIARQVLVASSRVLSKPLFTWIGTNSWGRQLGVITGVESHAEGVVTLSLDAPPTQALTDFTSYLRSVQANSYNPWFSEYNSSSSLSVDSYVPYTLQAVDAVLIGIDNAVKQACGSQAKAFCSGLLNNKWPVIYDNIRRVDVKGVVKFDPQTGDQVYGKHAVNVVRKQVLGADYVQIGSYSGGKLVLNQDLGVTSVCGQYPCTVCGEVQSTADPTTTTTTITTTRAQPDSQAIEQTPPNKLRSGDWVIALIALAAIGIFLVIAFEIYLSYKMSGKNFIRSMWLGQMLLFALFLSFLCLFAFVPAPTHATCGVIRFSLGICYAMIFSVFLVKLMIIFSSKSIGYLKGIFQVLMFVFAWGVQIAIDVEWLIMRPPEALPVVDNTTGEIQTWVCSQSFSSHVITLSYVMFLILMCTLLSFKAHSIVTNHREVVYIGICSLLSIVIFLVWVLLGILNTNKDFEDPCLAFGLFIIALITLLTMYLPKVRQLNSMGKEGLYLDYDTPDYTTPSIIPPSLQAPSLVISNGGAYKPDHMTYDHVDYRTQAPPSVVYKSDPLTEPVVFVDDIHGDIYTRDTKVHRLHVDAHPEALYLKHPGSLTRTLPVVHTASLYGDSQHSAPSNTRVLKRTVDLSGRSAPDKTYSEVNTPVKQRVAYSEVNAPSHRPMTYSEVNAPSHRAMTYSEVNAPTLSVPRGYGTARSVISARSGRSGGTLARSRSLHDVGSL